MWTSCFVLISTINLIGNTASEMGKQMGNCTVQTYHNNHSFYTVELSSSISHLGRTRVCPKETVLYECFVMGPSLDWQLSGIFHQCYDNNSDKNVVNRSNDISVWLNNSTNEHMKSTLILTYTPSLNNIDVDCNNKSSKYIIAGMTLLLSTLCTL